MRHCPSCGKDKELSEFYVQKTVKYAGKPTTECKACVSIRSSTYYAENKARAAASHRNWVSNNRETVKFHKARSAYGLTREQFDSIIRVCVICGRTENLVFDHSHQTGRVRGRLCHSCNKGLGFFRDDPTLLLRASDYVLGISKPDIFQTTYEPAPPHLICWREWKEIER